ncbi:hypothetical protein [Streptomyces sp. NPDC046197]|uniref:hypothetical protein n=1 Tax=Streptomyces sp. NPDC046197 TaxID=3154337 RepID=UPI0033C949B5
MSNDKKTTEAETANAEATEITTLNSHATSEPLRPVALSESEGGIAKPDNSHATDEKA